MSILTPAATVLSRLDATAYARRLSIAGGTDIIANGQVKQLQAFAEALYASVGRTDFWPLRSTQNMGTGAVAYSFHGVAGTLVNGPTWDTTGIVPSGTSYIDSGVPDTATVGNDVQLTFVGLGCEISGDATMIGKYDGGFEGGLMSLDAYASYVSARTARLGSYSDGTFAKQTSGLLADGFFAARRIGNTHSLLANGAVVASQTATPPDITRSGRHFFIGAMNNADVASSLSAATATFALIGQALSDAQNAALYAAHKATLGQGLGLP